MASGSVKNSVAIYDAVEIPSTSVNSDSFATIATITVPSTGVYIIEANIAFASGSGIRILLVDYTETDNNAPANSVLAEGRATLQKTKFYLLSPSDTIYIRAFQNTGSAMNVSCSYRLLRV